MRASEALRAPAKINLTLEVLGRRADGLHGLRSVMVPIDLCDELHVRKSEDGGFSFRCDIGELQEHNLAQRAFDALHLTERGYEIALRKRIPTGAGLGGGSSDAAAVLLAAQRGAFGCAPEIDYVGTARSLGSDVPFFLVETAALVEGTGERVTALGPVPQWHVVVVKPPIHVSTAWAYEEIDARCLPSRPRSGSASLQMAEALQRDQFDLAVELMQNDFHQVMAQTEEICGAIDVLRAAGAANAMLTGSGSCVFTLVRDAGAARTIAERAARQSPFETFAAAFWNGAAWRSAA